MARFTATLIFSLFVLTRRNSIGVALTRTSGEFTPNPIMGKQDAFTPSEPYEGKVFLYPWVTEERMGDWYYNRGYCAYHNAEMVTIRDEKENDFFYNFMHQVGMRPFGVWLGAQSNDKQRFTHWNNNEVATFQPVMPGEYNEPGLTCIDMAFYATERKWRNWYCAGFPESKNHYIACQRKATPTVNTCDDGQMMIKTTDSHICFCMPIKNTEFIVPTGGSHCNLHNVACRYGTSPTNCSWTVTTTDSQYCVCVPTDDNTVNVQLCPKTNDLLIVLDSSDSISSGDYEIAKRFINRLVTALMVNRRSRVGFTTYSTEVHLEFSIKNTLSVQEISTKILNAAHHADGTNTHLGIVTALDDYKSAARTETVNMVLLTDGKSKDLTATADAVTKAHDLNIRTYAVGIGSDVNQEELLMIADGDASGVFTTSTFSELVKILTPISKKLCE